MRAITDFLINVTKLLCILLLTVLVIVVTWQVFNRQVLGRPLSWSEEMARYLLVWLSLISATLLFAERGHIAIHMGVRMLPKKMHVASQLLVEALVVIWAGVVLLFGGARASANAFGQQLSAMPGTVGMAYMMMPIAGALVIWFSINHMVQLVSGKIPALPAEESAEEVIPDGRS